MARRDYRGDTGVKLPGVTNILGILNAPALVFWGYRQGKWNFDEVTERIIGVIGKDTPDMDARFLIMQIKDAISDFPVRSLYEKRDAAADAGTLAHLFVEEYLKGCKPSPVPPGPVGEKAYACYKSFREWEKNHQFQMVASEIQLVSKLGFGGTIDIGAVLSDLNIVDIKTSPDIYLKMKCQVAAYGQLWNENSPDRPIKGYRILRLGSQGDFSEHYWSHLDEEWEIFLDCLDIYKRLQATGQKL